MVRVSTRASLFIWFTSIYGPFYTFHQIERMSKYEYTLFLSLLLTSSFQWNIVEQNPKALFTSLKFIGDVMDSVVSSFKRRLRGEKNKNWFKIFDLQNSCSYYITNFNTVVCTIFYFMLLYKYFFQIVSTVSYNFCFFWKFPLL